MKPISYFLVAAAAAATVAAGQTRIRKTEIRYVPAGDGAEMYQAYCASCHGADAKGRGPAAAALKVPATDLTKLAAGNNGEFPGLRVMNTLGNNTTAEAHGSSDMPVWGAVFRGSGQNNSEVQMRVYSLMQFLEAIQDPPAVHRKKVKEPMPLRAVDVDATSGEAMFKAYCASCHGADGRGFGPAAKAITPQIPDLTVLTRTHNGKFPDTHIADVLNLRGVNVTAHGSKDMPVWGTVFRASGEDSARVHLRIANIANYLKSIQQ